MIAALLVASLIALHGPDGQVIAVNPDHIVSLRPPRAAGHFPAGTRCLVGTVDGKLVMVQERCPDVRRSVAPSP